ncbi:MAG TPA: SdrD B-like domain-containing protein, partial [Bryobacteraceae bacterium]|nr:SdrD B-like domain-containing protein [Bryobacteraceae bacterium]
NIITNPGAEASATATTGWTANGTPQVVAYGASEGGFPSVTDPGPALRGKNFFAGGPSGSESDLFQTIDISSLAANIDAHQIKYSLSAYLGGFSSQKDQATVFANFQGGVFSQTSVGPVSPTDRQSQTGLLLRSTSGTIPAGTRKIQMQMHFEALSGGYIDGYADNLSMVLTSTANVLGKIAGTVYNDLNGDAIKQSTEGGLANVTVFVDKNKNGILDVGEPKTTTAANGTYTIASVVAGTYQVREIVPATFRATTANPVTVTVANGGTSTANFGDSQTVLITGNVFNDANGNKIKDATEKGIAGVTVYLDFNNNGQLDSFELKTTTDANGNFKFVEPFGTYVVREVLPSGKTATLGGNGYSVALAKGKSSALLLFGDK